MHPLLTNPYTATTAVTGRRFVKHGAADGAVVQAAAATDKIVGVSAPMGAEAGAVCDVVELGYAEVEYGGNVARGDPLTADADGKAVKAAPAATATAEVGAWAIVSGVAGDFAKVRLGRFTLANPTDGA